MSATAYILGFMAVYAGKANVNGLADCHDRNPASPRKGFDAGEVIGSLIACVPMEF
jgi:hypothetical protein